jgi:hypothetical protein
MNLAFWKRWSRWQRLRAPRSPTVDFLHPDGALRPLVALLWLITLMVVFTTWEHWRQMHDQQRQTDELEQQFIQLARQQEQLIQSAIHLSPRQKQQLAIFAEQAATPFPLLDALGQAWSREVALTRLEVNTQTQILNLDLEARLLGDAFRFVERLKALEGIHVSLQQSSRKTNDPSRPVLVKLTLGGG